jgi:hypothetical protein
MVKWIRLWLRWPLGTRSHRISATDDRWRTSGQNVIACLQHLSFARVAPTTRSKISGEGNMHETPTHQGRLIRVPALVFAAGVATMLVISTTSSSGQGTQPTATPVKVADAATAVNLAEKALAKVYGKRQIDSERPFNASLSDGVWHVSGTLYCKDKNGNLIVNACVGGVAMADIRQSDGRVMRTGHTQ